MCMLLLPFRKLLSQSSDTVQIVTKKGKYGITNFLWKDIQKTSD